MPPGKPGFLKTSFIRTFAGLIVGIPVLEIFMRLHFSSLTISIGQFLFFTAFYALFDKIVARWAKRRAD